VSANRAYLDALRMLARRELSEAQIRQRLARREHDPDLIDEAAARLKEERALDDVRVAEAIARTETSVRKRGRLRVMRKIESAGISKSIAKQAVDAVYGALDADALLEAALAKRLRGRGGISDHHEFNRLYRYLIGQGFEPARVLATLRRKQKNR
jgi:regulatory protein